MTPQYVLLKCMYAKSCFQKTNLSEGITRRLRKLNHSYLLGLVIHNIFKKILLSWKRGLWKWVEKNYSWKVQDADLHFRLKYTLMHTNFIFWKILANLGLGNFLIVSYGIIERLTLFPLDRDTFYRRDSISRDKALWEEI